MEKWFKILTKMVCLQYVASCVVLALTFERIDDYKLDICSYQRKKISYKKLLSEKRKYGSSHIHFLNEQCVKVIRYEQLKSTYGFNLLCTAWICFFKHLESARNFPHSSHFFFEYQAGVSSDSLFMWDTEWFRSWDSCLNFFLQTEHANCLSSECINMWMSIFERVAVL